MSGPLNELDKQTHDEFCCTMAALICHDEGLEISADKIQKLCQASGNKIDAYWAPLFAKALAGRNIGDLLAGGAPAPQAATVNAGTAAPKEEKKQEAKKPEKKEEEEADMEGAMDLFGGDDDF